MRVGNSNEDKDEPSIATRYRTFPIVYLQIGLLSEERAMFDEMQRYNVV